DPETGLVAEVTYRSPDGIPVVRAEVVLRNDGDTTLHLESVTSLVLGGLAPVDAADLLWADNEWAAECRWRHEPLRLTAPDVNGRVPFHEARTTFALAGRGTWSSCGHLPMGGLTDRRSG